MSKYRLLNNLIGWAVFVIASAVYLLTAESTASLWDCGEFIACGYKLEIGHPPGAPVFMLLCRLFAIFTADVTKVAFMVNSLSALASSFTILFLFWSITHMARKLVIGNTDDYSTINQIKIFGSALVGSLCYTFSDTFWFSAVEGEVYATSSLFTAVVFWAILKWENEADEKHATRWLILIGYLMGLSIGVHLLNLLTIPALVLVFYFRKYTVTPRGTVYALILSVIILGSFQYIIIPGVVKIATLFELQAVNTFGLPYFSGVFIYLALIIGFIVWGLYWTQKENHIILNHLIAFLTVVLIGYSTYALIVIRSKADPPLDENNPENMFALLSYLNREQYGDRPFLYGPYYSAPIIGIKEKGKQYIPRDGRYVVSEIKKEYKYDPQFMTFFPRMHSRRPDHIREYKNWGGEPRKVKTMDEGEMKNVEKPGFGNNLKFFFTYQLGHMYFRYFMWNFSGRQNDVQSYGELLNGNWISGIPFIDKLFLGPQDNLPKSLSEHESRNKYYLLPFLLGLAGLFFQFNKHKKDFVITMALFLLTGIAIIIYLNQPPLEPRERDYTYAGSFYAFSIWVGLGVLSVIQFLSKRIPAAVSSVLATVLCLGFVPGIMAKENWNDHDRSGRYTARDIAYNYLMSCAPNAILFTNGDNDTFPLWYAQEVEGIRTDVRVVNLMLLNTDWHITQARRKAYTSEKLPITLGEDKWVEGTNNIVYIQQGINTHTDIREIINWVKSTDPRTKLLTQENERLDYIPTKKFRLYVDTNEVLKNGTVRPELRDQMVSYIDWEVNKRYLTKSELIMLDILANNNWKRPVYFVSPGNDNTLGLDNYLQMEGLAYRLVPIKTQVANQFDIGRFDSDSLYHDVMEVFRWGRMDQQDVYLGHFDIRTISVIRLRNLFHRLAERLIQENKKDLALKVIDKAVELMPHKKVPYDYYMLDLINDYYLLEKTEKANRLLKEFSAIIIDDLQYYMRLKKAKPGLIDQEINMNSHVLQRLIAMADYYKQNDLSKEVQEQATMLKLF